MVLAIKFLLVRKFLAELRIGETQEIYIHHRVREDASDLYGVSSLEELDLFELLLSVSGVGPKSALGRYFTGHGG